MYKISLLVFCLFVSTQVMGQITAAEPPGHEKSANSYFPIDDVIAIDSMAKIEQGSPSSFMIDPGTVQKRLAALQNVIPLVYNLQTHQFVEYFAFKKADFTQRMLEKRDVYFPLYEKYLKQYGLPDELKFLSLIESGLEPKAISVVGAGGLWQFMPYTARGDFGLRVDKAVDERFDPEKATEAACKYLKQLHRVFGDWHLALAAYNTGPGNVKRAIRKCGRSDFWAIYACLPKQTRAYVPQYIAMTYMMTHHADHAIHAEKWVKAIPSDSVYVQGYLNLIRLSNFAKIGVDTFKTINPHLVSNILPLDNRKVVVRIPSDKFAYFQANRKSILDSASFLTPLMQDSLVSANTVRYVKKKYKVKRGESVFDLARRFNVSVAELKRMNHLRSNKLKKGKMITYLVAVRESIERSPEPSNRVYVAKTKVKFYRVRPGDTLSEIADRHKGLSVEKLKKLNRIRASATLRPGMRLRIS